MAESAAKNGPCLVAARRIPRSAPRVQAKPNRAIELSSSDLEIVEVAPPSGLRLVPPPLRKQRRATTWTREVTHRGPPKPVRAIELSSSDLEILETDPASKMRLAQPPPLRRQLIDEGTRTHNDQNSVQIRPPSVMTRRFGFRAQAGFIAQLCIAITAAALTITRPPDHRCKIQDEIAWNGGQSSPLALVSQGAPPGPAMKSAAEVRPSSNPKAFPQKVRAQSSHVAVANVKVTSKGKLATTTSTHGKSAASTGTKRRLTSTASFPVDL